MLQPLNTVQHYCVYNQGAYPSAKGSVSLPFTFNLWVPGPAGLTQALEAF